MCPDDVLVARRAELRAELVRLQRRDRLGARDLRVLAADERLVHVVVGVREVDHAIPLGRVRDLRHVEVEALVARPVRLGERGVDAVHLALREAELPRDRVGDRRLVALAAVRVRDLPRLPRLSAAPPRRECRVVGADRQPAFVLRGSGCVFAQPGIWASADWSSCGRGKREREGGRASGMPRTTRALRIADLLLTPGRTGNERAERTTGPLACGAWPRRSSSSKSVSGP